MFARTDSRYIKILTSYTSDQTQNPPTQTWVRNYFKWFIGNIAPIAGHKESLHPLSFFIYALVTFWKLNLSYILFKSMVTLIPNQCARKPNLSNSLRLMGCYFQRSFITLMLPSIVSLQPPPALSLPPPSKLMNLSFDPAPASLLLLLHLLTLHLPLPGFLHLFVHPSKLLLDRLSYLNLVCLPLEFIPNDLFHFCEFTNPHRTSNSPPSA